MTIISVDIGLHGAISILRDSRITSYGMPTYTTINYAGKKRVKYDVGEISRIIINSVAIDRASIIVCEDVHTFKKQGSVSNFTFGLGLGIFTGIQSVLGLKLCKIDPRLWKRHFDLIGRDKKASINLVRNLFDIETKSDGVADSILIGSYYLDKLQGMP